VSVQFDSHRDLTTIVAAKPLDLGPSLEGRVLRIGTRWSAVKEFRGNQITVWGDLSAGTDQNQAFEIIPSYRTR
jgi:hypothetical protein